MTSDPNFADWLAAACLFCILSNLALVLWLWWRNREGGK